MALIHTSPHLVRDHLLLCASRQFRKGMCSIGGTRLQAGACVHIVRMIISGYHWQRAAMYLHTGDTGVLDETVHFLEGRPVKAEDDSYYDLPSSSEESPAYTSTACEPS